MCKFIEVNAYKRKILINLDHVEQVESSDDGSCTIYQCYADKNAIEQDYIKPNESYEQIRTMIGAAQGGIPMEPGRMY